MPAGTLIYGVATSVRRFYRGPKLDRTLVLRMPPGGVPDDEQGEFYVGEFHGLWN